MKIIRKTFVATPREVALLDRLQSEKGLSHSASIRLAILSYAPTILRHIATRKPKR